MEETKEESIIFKAFKYIICSTTLWLIIISIAITLFMVYSSSNYSILREHRKYTESFKGYNLPTPSQLLEYEFKKEYLHFVVYGKTGSGKTTFVKKYIEKFYDSNMVVVFCKDRTEWSNEFKHIYSEEDLYKLKNYEDFANTLIVLDDMGSLFNQKDVSEIFTKARHVGIQIIVLAHKACDVDIRIRSNIDLFYVTTGNSSLLFENIKESYKIKNICFTDFQKVSYGIIRYDTIMNEYVVLDKDNKIVYDSINKNSIPSTFSILPYVGVSELSEKEIRLISKFLISQAKEPIVIIPETFYFYFDYYVNNILNIPTPPRLKTPMSFFEQFMEYFRKVKPMVKEIYN